MLIRDERAEDRQRISQIHYAAFKGHPMHAPGQEPSEHRIVEQLRRAEALSLSLLAEADGEVQGHVALSPATVGQDHSGWFLLGPVGVLPGRQGQGIGSSLVRETLRRMRGKGAAGVVLVGDPGFYGRLGFVQVPGLVYEGVPDRYVLAASFGARVPQGQIKAHAAFAASAQEESPPPLPTGQDGGPCADGTPLCGVSPQLRALGLDPWFETQGAGPGAVGCAFARVVAVDRGSCLVRNGSGTVPAELSGRLAYQIDNPADLPCVGDWVFVQYYNGNSAAVIQQLLPRRTFLRRRAPGTQAATQMIAANIDTAFLVQSCHFDFNPKRLERYLVMAAEGGVQSVVLLTKADLVPKAELEQKLAALGSLASARVLALSSVTGLGIDSLLQTLVPGRTYCLLGSSGVGKTTLINRLLGRESFETRAVSGTGEGTHATTRRQLVVLSQGAMLIDTPGMRELGMACASAEVAMGFGDLAGLSAQCRYADCSHRHEPGCAVRAAIEEGELQAERYANYLKLKKEAQYNEMTSLDKRKKDKAFGRFMKSAKKSMRG